jgi:hypothetical protein
MFFYLCGFCIYIYIYRERTKEMKVQSMLSSYWEWKVFSRCRLNCFVCMFLRFALLFYRCWKRMDSNTSVDILWRESQHSWIDQHIFRCDCGNNKNNFATLLCFDVWIFQPTTFICIVLFFFSFFSLSLSFDMSFMLIDWYWFWIVFVWIIVL